MTFTVAIGHMEEGLTLTYHSSVLPSHNTHSLCNLSLLSPDMPLLHTKLVALSAPYMTAKGYFDYSPIPTFPRNIN